jgi:hypothetical protein
MHMDKRMATVLLAVSVLVAFVDGCASRTTTASPASASDIRDLVGAWTGYIVQPGGTLYTVEARAVLQINPDGTFVATGIPAPAANNLAKQSRWSGTVVVNGRHITFKTEQGPWATLVRHGDHLYGVANDPLTEMDIMIDFARART